jgi:hypothetical protein
MRAIVAGISIAFVLGWAGTARGELRTWTDISGKYHYEAEFISLEDNLVKLRLSNGKTAGIPFGKLSEADRAVVIAAMKGRGGAAADKPPALEIEESPQPKKNSETAEHFLELLKRPGEEAKLLALEGLGKIGLESLDESEQTQGLWYLGRIKGFGNHEAWDEASSTIARHYSINLKHGEAVKAWFDYVSDKHTSKYNAEAWFRLGHAREKLAGDDLDKLNEALSAYLFCFVKYKNQVRYSSAAWRRAAEIEWNRGEREKARKLIGLMVEELGGLAAITDPKKRSDDVKWAQIELNRAKALREKWSGR